MVLCLQKPQSVRSFEVNSIFPLAEQTKSTQFYNAKFLSSNPVLVESRMTNPVPSTVVSPIGLAFNNTHEALKTVRTKEASKSTSEKYSHR